LLRPKKKRSTAGIGKTQPFFTYSLAEVCLVKKFLSSGNEEKFDSKNVKKDLEAAGLPERVAEEVSELVEDKVQDRWTTIQVNEQVDIVLKRF